MKKYLLLAFALIICNVQAFATHIFGGELLYTNISGNTYKVTLTLYGDCASSIFSTLFTSAPIVNIYDGSSLVQSVNLAFDTNSGTEVSPVCAAELKNTSCNGGALPGVKQFFFTDTITLPHTSANWDFVFAGSLSSTTNAGRSSNISNIVNPGASIMYLFAKLDNTSAQNSSPQYTTIPTPYYCINIAQQYNPGAVDPNGDSLVFKLVPGLVGGSPVSYISPYTATQPLSADGFTFDSSNGQMNFSLNLIQDALIVNEVDEYRDGKLIGTSMREMTFVGLSSCTNAPPVNTNSNAFTNITGGVVADTNLLISCNDLSFTISPTDPNNDTMDISWVGLPPHATLTVTGNATPTPQVVFNWPAPYVGPLGSLHTFYITYKNRGCPLSSKKTVAYNIRVLYPPSASLSQIGPTSCIDAASLQFTINQEGGADPI
ncbi:MAG TPA: hypothetical protein VN721_16965, partial [Flavipsychrobacter sp.]|nr:hypothetical protein [Flavipsychrobacter sp.]